MSTYRDLILVVCGLVPGTAIEITVSWCAQHNIVVDERTIKVWGRRFHIEYMNYGVRQLGKHSNNLCYYEKM